MEYSRGAVTPGVLPVERLRLSNFVSEFTPWSTPVERLRLEYSRGAVTPGALQVVQEPTCLRSTTSSSEES